MGEGDDGNDVEGDTSITDCSLPSLTALSFILILTFPVVHTFSEGTPILSASFVGEPGYFLNVLRPCGGG